MENSPSEFKLIDTDQSTGLNENYGLRAMAESFKRSLRANDKAETTIKAYMMPVNGFIAFATSMGMPREMSGIKREHVESYLLHLKEREGINNGAGTGRKLSPAYRLKQYKGLKIWFDWAVEEEEIKRSPMEKIKAPRVGEIPVPVITDDDLRRLLKVCDGKEFYERRDLAIIRLLIDTGMRRAEIGNLKVQDINFSQGLACVTGKGSKVRQCPFGRKTSQALDRYLRARSKYSDAAHDSALWIGKNGPMGPWGIGQVLEKRAQEAKIPPIHPHMFRHTFSHKWRVAGGQNDDLKRLMGWSSDSMLYRYGASAADSRAHEAHKRMNIGDDL